MCYVLCFSNIRILSLEGLVTTNAQMIILGMATKVWTVSDILD